MRIFHNKAELDAALSLDKGAPGVFRFLPEYFPAVFLCADCGKHKPLKSDGGGTGYGYDGVTNAIFCYPCGAKRHFDSLERDGKGYLYLSPTTLDERKALGASAAHKLTDWTGERKIPIYRVQSGGHNFAGTRYDVWFTLGGRDWHGVQYGDNTQVCHVRRLKAKESAR